MPLFSPFLISIYLPPELLKMMNSLKNHAVVSMKYSLDVVGKYFFK